MRPVDKGRCITRLRAYGNAKPDLLSRIGEFCSYCECSGAAQQLHIEHVYPKDPHPGLATNWRNLLLSCATCNTYKSKYLGNSRQSCLLRASLWPHIDNTFNAFEYQKSGLVRVRHGLSPAVSAEATRLLDMVGLMQSPTVAAKYEALGIAYDGTTRRTEAWGIASRALEAYRENPTAKMLETICDNCYSTGYFSVWMTVFRKYANVRQAFIKRCRAACECFDGITAKPLTRGRV